jgi:hypothetical protein
MQSVEETCSNIWMGKHLSDTLRIQNFFIIIAFNFALECEIRKVHVKQGGLKLNGMYHFLQYADDVNLLYKNMNAVKK